MKYIYRRLLSLVLYVFILLKVNAQNNTGILKGEVTLLNGKPAQSVLVKLKGTSKTTQTNAHGNFLLNNLNPSHYELLLSLPGYEDRSKEVTVYANDTTTLSIQLKVSEQQLEEVIVQTASTGYKYNHPSNTLRLNEPLLQAPQNIQVLSGELLSDQRIFDMLEGVSRNVSGVTKLEHWDNYARLNMRGSRVAPFRNGMNVQSTWGPLAEDMSFVDRIEFVKGPAGFMLANGEPAGFYNVVTKKPTGINKRSVEFTVGSFNTYRATADIDGKFTEDGKLLYRLNLMGQSKESFRDFEYSKRYAAAPVIKYLFNNKTSLTAEYTYQFLRMSTIGSAYVFVPNKYGELPQSFSVADPGLSPSDMYDHSAFLTFEHKFNDNWKLTAQLAAFFYKQIGSSLWASSLDSAGNLSRYISSWDANNKSEFAQLFTNGKIKTGKVVHNILVGIDYGNKKYLADWNQYFPLDADAPFNIYHPAYGLLKTIPVIDRTKSLKERAGGNILAEKYAALYVQDELRFFEEKLRLTLAGRYTFVKDNQYETTTDDRKFTPRVGLSFSLDKFTSVYGLYDQAFLPQAGSDRSGKPFVPVTGNNTEFGIKKDWFDGRWNSTVSVYQITKNHSLISDPQDPNFSIQTGQIKTKGVELDIHGRITKGLNAVINYAYTDPKYTKDETNPENVGTKAPGFAEHISNAWISYTLSKGGLQNLNFSLGYQWQVNRFPWFVTPGSTSPLPDYFRLDGSIGYQKNRYNISLNVNNILNRYLLSGSPYDFNFDGKNDGFYYQAEAPINYRISFGVKF